MAGSPKKRAQREKAGLPVAPRSQLKFNIAALRKMREGGMSTDELRRFGLTNENFTQVMGFAGGTESAHAFHTDVYLPTEEERDAVRTWVVAGYKSPLKLKEMLLEDFGLDLTVSVIARAFRVELLLAKERVAVQATKNIVADINAGDVSSSFRFMESAGKWNGKDGGVQVEPGNLTINNTQINITPENAAATYQKLIKGN